jgi:hypothetical protein
MLAPEPHLTACLAVLSHATIHARLIAWGGEASGLTARQSSQIADIMDAVHNIPQLLQRWEDCDQALLRAMLHDLDAKWGLRLLEVYDAAPSKR